MDTLPNQRPQCPELTGGKGPDMNTRVYFGPPDNPDHNERLEAVEQALASAD
jgi:hypothetical protein